jgi:hypothetical protein
VLDKRFSLGNVGGMSSWCSTVDVCALPECESRGSRFRHADSRRRRIRHLPILLCAAAVSLLARTGCLDCLAQNIYFTNRFETITNAGGESVHAELVYADLDGIIYRCPGGGGRLSYTNLSLAELVSLGVPTNRVAAAEQRAALRSEQKKEEAARQAQQAALALQQRAERDQAMAAQQQAAGTQPAPGQNQPKQHKKGKKAAPPPGSN